MGSMDRVTKATFLRDGRLARLGIRGGEEGWFIEGADTVVLSQVSPDERWIAATRLKRSKQLRRLALR